MTTTTTEAQAPTTVPITPVEAKSQDALPKLSHADFQLYNKMAVMMDYYHNHFRHTWNTIYTSCTTNSRPKGMSIPSFLGLITQFTRSLTIHHTIEETHIFPRLATKMPQFREDADMLTQHEGIHAGIEKLEAYVREVRRGDRELRLNDESEGSLKAVMDSFGAVLWTHLDAEVKNLGAENMRLYWSKREMEGFNF